ncbi:CubicO group peptidase (beta-lactamase class C family) [Hymenobacter luteus]|uniref:CubicO group peptidase (Beta-lactamase class C family) n=2 Tax=Hymenobacter TaxID=89966 RepID=A0A7W9WEC7_9BACT|nr:MULTISPECIES: serine hydrolase [Hymenobacter]MBB4602656.1 CubicO group peptidase (beta-lactamase class C family) [Hymenobacter latericoloratus]MBB6060547.1 CubicO group peptidase (beta-lactamase class C family) [Hymenobacter luteus]
MKTPRTSAWAPLVWLVLFLSLGTASQAQAATPPDSLDLFLQAKMRQLRIPGLQLAVIRHGKIIRTGQYGLANVQDSVPVTGQTRFTINSITKAFVGVAVMQLVEAGKLDLAAPASRYLEGLPAAWQPVTVRQMLTHTSGLPDIMPDDEMVTESTESAAWAKVQTQPMDFAPGEKFAYNQTNYLLLGKIIDKLSGQPFIQFIQERQLNVVGMPRTTFGDAHDVLPHGARGYTYYHNSNGQMRRGNQLRNTFETFPPMLRTAAGMSSTAEEVARWIIALQQGQLLKLASLPTLWTPGNLNNGTQRGFSRMLNGYALGWPTVARPEHRAVAPVGGGRSALFIYPDDDLAIVVLTNLIGANPDVFMDEIAGHYLPDMRAVAGFGLPPTIRALHTELRKRGFAQASALVKQEKKKNAAYQLPEDEVNTWGYMLLRQNMAQEALEVFKLNVSLYPQSANTYDSLAETYADLGNQDLAAKNYKRALALNPKNTAAAAYLKKLQN